MQQLSVSSVYNLARLETIKLVKQSTNANNLFWHATNTMQMDIAICTIENFSYTHTDYWT